MGSDVSVGEPLPIARTVGESIGEVFGGCFRELPAACLVPFALATLIGAAKIGLDSAFFDQLWYVLLIPVEVIPGVLFSVTWYRLILLGPERAKPKLWSGWSVRHWWFFGYFVLFEFAFYIEDLVFSNQLGWTHGRFAEFVSVIGFIFVVWWLSLRLSFVLPNAAIDQSYSLRSSWRDTRQQGARLLIGGVLVMLPYIALLAAAVTMLSLFGAPGMTKNVPGTGSFTAILLVDSIYNILGFVAAALGAAYISIAFRTITGWGPPSGSPHADQTQIP